MHLILIHRKKSVKEKATKNAINITENIEVNIDSFALLKALGFGRIEGAYIKKSTIVIT